MTITNTVKHLPSGKPGLNIIANLDEVAIIRGLVVNALRHMPDVGETTSTRQRLKAMSRALHRVYTSDYVKAPVDWPFITTPSVRTATATPEQVSKIVAMIRDCERRDWKASTFVGGQCGKNWAKKYMKAQARETDLAVQSLYGQLEIQGQDGNWNCNSYMMGLYNGIELAIATLENREPRYRNKPETGWLDDKLPAGLADAPVATAGIRGPDTLVAYADPKPSVDPLTAEKMAQPPAQVAKYGGRPIIYSKPVLPGVSAQLPRYKPFTDQESLMKLLAEMPTEFRFDEFHKRVIHCVQAVNAAMHGIVTKEAEQQVVQECNTFLFHLPKDVFEVDGVFQTVKRKGYVAVTYLKSIPNPDYVSPAAPSHPDNSTADLKQQSVPEEDRGHEAPAPAHRTTLFAVYDKMDESFTFETLRSRASEYGHDRIKVSAFVNLMCQIGSLRHEGGFKYTKLSNVREPDMRRLASLIA